jgi:AraC-like DNA-binding protein
MKVHPLIKLSEKYHTFGFLIWSGKPTCFRQWHRHSEVEINLVARGEMRYQCGPAMLRIREGEVASFWGMTSHLLTGFAPRTFFHWLSIPLPMLLQWDLPWGLIAALLRGEPLHGKIEPYADLPRLFNRWKEDMALHSPEREKLVQREVQNCLSRLWFHTGKEKLPSNRRKSQAENGALGKLGKMARYTAENYREPITVADIARTAGIHPHYAMTLFRRTCAMSIVDYVTQLRIGHAQRLLLSTDLKILDIAHESGFRTSSHFYTAFRRITGASPKKFAETWNSGASGEEKDVDSGETQPAGRRKTA